MKRKPILLALALLLVVGAALWGVNCRLDHPPLTKADKEFRGIVAGADAIEITQDSCQERPECENGHETVSEKLTAAQARTLIEHLRFLDKQPVGRRGRPPQVAVLYFHFLRKGRASETIYFTLLQTADEAHMYSPQHLSKSFILNPRFNKRLNRVLDAYLPQRIRP